ncbi:MAG TPA: septum formation inhibitor Maf [Methylococcaceae bacterium]|jgi:septum formation protein|nr:septum formation inhibitor Maf [Methylococcaceae bacterium]HIN69129.1 septum formation inhibitor Maf [Methylococcales bacterium]HIA45112.1 septum formation inhibitor Maf [Methylococcaceae bacterium]HIB63129.1 septum formation inhibitor Maf [Methylococcaceae bacterium]HIO12246.1 septum formation inhibitor Maf [Methylococcales bacterium]
MTAEIILASASPRRRELLEQMGLAYLVRVAEVDESVLVSEPPVDYVRRVAAKKSQQVWQSSDHCLPVLSADTSVVLNGMIMGKPKDQVDALIMLEALSGVTHQVLTAVSLRYGQHWQALSISEVTFRVLSAQEIRDYWATGEPVDKAGGYAIQGLGAMFVERCSGSYSGIVGLPLFETMSLLENVGVKVLKQA